MNLCCVNCGEKATEDDLLVLHRRQVIGAVCASCTDGVRKPRVTCTRTTRTGPFEAYQYSCVEMFDGE